MDDSGTVHSFTAKEGIEIICEEEDQASLNTDCSFPSTVAIYENYEHGLTSKESGPRLKSGSIDDGRRVNVFIIS